MADAREEILGLIRKATASALLPGSQPKRPANTTPRVQGGVERFVEEARKLSAEVLRVGTAAQAVEAVAGLCRERGWARALAWEWDEVGVEGLGEALAVAGVEAAHGGAPADLEPVPVGITGAEAGLADTGTLVLQSGAGRSPLASLLPPVHVALLDARRIFPEMRAYLESLDGQVGAGAHVRAASHTVFISGPSRTSDIEQTLTLGVHGPRELIIVVYG